MSDGRVESLPCIVSGEDGIVRLINGSATMTMTPDAALGTAGRLIETAARVEGERALNEHASRRHLHQPLG